MKFQLQAKIIAWIDIVCSSVFMFLFLLTTMVILTDPDFLHEGIEKQGDQAPAEVKRLMAGSILSRVLILSPSFAYLAAEIILGLYLLRAAESLNYKKLRTWFVVTLTMFVVLSVLFVPAFLMMAGPPNWTSIIFFGSNVLFTLYSLFVVHNLRHEIKDNVGAGEYSAYPPPPVYEASFSNANYYPSTQSDKEFLKI